MQLERAAGLLRARRMRAAGVSSAAALARRISARVIGPRSSDMASRGCSSPVGARAWTVGCRRSSRATAAPSMGRARATLWSRPPSSWRSRRSAPPPLRRETAAAEAAAERSAPARAPPGMSRELHRPPVNLRRRGRSRAPSADPELATRRPRPAGRLDHDTRRRASTTACGRRRRSPPPRRRVSDQSCVEAPDAVGHAPRAPLRWWRRCGPGHAAIARPAAGSHRHREGPQAQVEGQEARVGLSAARCRAPRCLMVHGSMAARVTAVESPFQNLLRV